MLKGAEASERVVPSRNFKSRVGDHPARGDVTTLPHHSFWLQLQCDAGGRRGGRGTLTKTEVAPKLVQHALKKTKSSEKLLCGCVDSNEKNQSGLCISSSQHSQIPVLVYHKQTTQTFQIHSRRLHNL